MPDSGWKLKKMVINKRVRSRLRAMKISQNGYRAGLNWRLVFFNLRTGVRVKQVTDEYAGLWVEIKKMVINKRVRSRLRAMKISQNGYRAGLNWRLVFFNLLVGFWLWG
ncbi:MAG: hypothetical protein NkDv07_0709 [Candidatus Improbicoccus devescovinae]|nr:MAG: hypothetical protein NkDv07_0709 [Candidatus Improbicoccus devescovinae]